MATINSINTSYPIGASTGGTGLDTITAHGIMVGEGTSPVTPIVLANGQLLIGSTGADPSAATVTSTASTLTVTAGAGTLNIDITAPVTVAYGGTGAVTLTSHGILLGNGTSAVTASSAMTNGQLLIGDTGNAPVVSTLTAGTGISVTNGAGTITIATTAAPGGGFTWNDQTTTSVTMAAGNAYIVDNASLVTLTLPATAALGDTYVIVGKGAGGWLMAQAASEVTHFSSATTTTGTGGSLASTQQFDCITIVCVTANTEFVVYTGVGNITYV